MENIYIKLLVSDRCWWECNCSRNDAFQCSLLLQIYVYSKVRCRYLLTRILLDPDTTSVLCILKRNQKNLVSGSGHKGDRFGYWWSRSGWLSVSNKYWIQTPVMGSGHNRWSVNSECSLPIEWNPIKWTHYKPQHKTLVYMNFKSQKK